MNRWELRFALGNLVALALVLVAVAPPWVGAGDRIPAGIMREYLPLALLLATLGTALVARFLVPERRGTFLARHFAIYAVVPLLLFIHSRSVEHSQAVLGAFYLLAVGAWTLHALEGLWHVVANLHDRTAAWVVAAVLLVPFLALLPYDRSVMPTASDEPHYLLIDQSLVGDHDLVLNNQYDDVAAYQAFYDGTLPDRHVIHVGETEYPIRDLGLPVIAALPFAIAGRTGVLVLMCLLAAGLAAQLYLACRDFGIGQRSAFLAVAGASLMHPLLTYTTQIYPELAAALAFVTAARLVRRGRATTPTQLALASACVGVLPWLSARAWFIGIGLGLVIAYCAFRPALRPTMAGVALRVAAGLLPFAALVLVLSYVDYRMFGLFMPNAGYYLVRGQQQVLAFTPQIGALGLLLDRVFGLVPRTPLYLVAALGVVPLFLRARNAELAALALGWLLYFGFIANVAYWWADGSPPSRYLLAGLPFLVVLLAAGIERLRELHVARSAAIAIAWGLAAFSLFIAYVYAVMPNLRYDLAVDISDSGSAGALFTFLGRIVRPDPALFFPSLVTAGPTDLLLGVVWLVVLVGLIALGRSERLATRVSAP